MELNERIAQITAHRAVGNQEQDLDNGKLAGYCLVCQTLWPCEYAGSPAKTTESTELEALKRAAVRLGRGEHSTSYLINAATTYAQSPAGQALAKLMESENDPTRKT